MEKKTIEMSQAEYKRYLAFREADKMVRHIKRGMHEVDEALLGTRKLKSARQLVNEL
ncbi:hypothetical protein FACS189456_0090 [Bacteroidia bacterium]|nr:hypothetical protein FACS189456_0090 [Bacteroidia bacterium]